MKLLKGVFILVILSVGLISSPAAAMQDIQGHWAEQSILNLSALRMISGFDDGTFKPDDTVTRSQFARILVAALGYSDEAQENMGYPTSYSDLSRGHWSAGYVQVASDLGLVTGYGDGTFRGEAAVSRAEITTMIVRAMGQHSLANSLQGRTPDFVDASAIPSWARGYVQAGYQLGAVTGYGDGSFRPSALTSRAEAATLVLRMLKSRGLHYDHYGVVESVMQSGLMVNTARGAQSFVLSPGASIYGNGESITISDISPFDEVFMVGRPDAITFVEARYIDEVGEARSVGDGSITYWSRSRLAVQTLNLEEGAPVFINGQISRLDQVQVGHRLYLVHSAKTGRIRLLDAVSIDVEGVIIESSGGSISVWLDSGVERTLTWSSQAVVYLDGLPVDPSEIQVGDSLAIHLDRAGNIQYAEALREVLQ